MNIVVSDDGNGMDRDGLREWFRVGESSKRSRVVSEGMELVGMEGIGELARRLAA